MRIYRENGLIVIDGEGGDIHRAGTSEYVIYVDDSVVRDVEIRNWNICLDNEVAVAIATGGAAMTPELRKLILDHDFLVAEIERWRQTIERFREHALNQMQRRYVHTTDYAYWSGRYDVLSTVLEQMAAATDEHTT
jgi:shikimate kinase